MEDFPDISADYVFTASKRLESKTGPFTYVLMFVFGTDAENKIESALNKYGEKAKRNYYAKDYAEKSSYITLSDSEIYLAVGQNGKISVTDFFIDKTKPSLRAESILFATPKFTVRRILTVLFLPATVLNRQLPGLQNMTKPSPNTVLATILRKIRRFF